MQRHTLRSTHGTVHITQYTVHSLPLYLVYKALIRFSGVAKVNRRGTILIRLR